MTDLDERMKAAGMIPLSELLDLDKQAPMDKWSAHAAVQSHNDFEWWLKMRYEEMMRMRISYELGDKDKEDELFEWIFAHSSALGEVLVNWKMMKKRMEEQIEEEKIL